MYPNFILDISYNFRLNLAYPDIAILICFRESQKVGMIAENQVISAKRDGYRKQIR